MVCLPSRLPLSMKVGDGRGSWPRGDQGRPLLGAERHRGRQERLYSTLGIFRDDRRPSVAAHQFVVHQIIVAKEQRADGAVGDDAGQRFMTAWR